MKKYEWPPLILKDGDRRYRSVEINDKGDLVFEQTDIGQVTAMVAPNGGDSDYESWVTVPSDHTGTLLIQLVRDRFKSESAFRHWLDRNKVFYKFFTY